MKSIITMFGSRKREGFLSLLILMATVLCFGQFAGGEGTADAPWQINTAVHLNNIRNYLDMEHNDKHFVQTANINLGIEPWNVDEGWVPIGSEEAGPFCGHYDGGRFSINNLTIDREGHQHQALFGWIWGATIKNVGLKNVNVNSGHYVAGLVAMIQGDRESLIDNCYVSGRVSGDDYVGGLIALVSEGESEIRNCYSAATIIPRENHIAGGLCAVLMTGSISRSYAIGLIDVERQTDCMGAVIGCLQGGEFRNLYWNRDTTGMQRGIGNNEEVAGNTTIELLSAETYEEFDFENIWRIAEGESYAFLRWQGEQPDEHNLPPLLPPNNLTATVGNRVVNLTWRAPPEELGEPDGYNVYRNGEMINEEPVAALLYRDEQLTNFTVYRYYVTALYGEEESLPSSTVEAVPYAFAGGNGTEEEPYLVATAEQLHGIRFFAAHFRQTANINLGVEPWNQEQGWVPIGRDPNDAFRGHYDGGIYTISGMTINRPTVSYQGLFGTIVDATVRNVGLLDVNVRGSMMVAGLIGSMGGNSLVQGCYVTGAIRSTGALAYTGGLIAYIYHPNSRLFDSYVTASVTTEGTLGHQYVGGLLSYLYAGTVSRCYASGMVTTPIATTNSGGIIGNVRVPDGMYSHLYWNRDTGGQERGIGNIQNTPGQGTAQMMQQNTFAGFDFDTVWRIDAGASYPYLRWEGDEAGDHNLPPFLPPLNLTGHGADETANLTWTAPPAIIGNPNGYNVYRNGERVNEQLVQGTEYRDGGLDNWTTYNYYVTAVYGQNESMPGTAVRILITAFAGGAGTPVNPYLVETADQLNGVRFSLRSHYRQTADISLAAYDTWLPIGDFADNNLNNLFRGVYDGGGHTISALAMLGRARSGLFGHLTDGAILKNVGLINVTIREAGQYSGALAGSVSSSTVSDCYAVGSLTATDRAGGLVGFLHGGEVINSWSSIELTSTGAVGGLVGVIGGNGVVRTSYSVGSTITTGNNAQDIGGLVGWVNIGAVVNSYSRSRVTAPDGAMYVGGLIGRNQATVTNSYSLGRVVGGNRFVGGLIGMNSGNVTNSYWNTETSEKAESAAGQGRTTNEMIYPYEDVNNVYFNWDFQNVWRNDSRREYNGGYPYLHWQVIDASENPNAAGNPQPQDRAFNVPVTLERLSWEYLTSELFADPEGFRVYFSTNLQIPDDAPFFWVPYIAQQRYYHTDAVLPASLAYRTAYYWKVVPTTNIPEERTDRLRLLRNVETRGCSPELNDIQNVSATRKSRRDHFVRANHELPLHYRGDAQNVPVWRFTTQINPKPGTARNPFPEDGAEDVSVTLDNLSWSYVSHHDYSNPAGFRLYLNTSGEFEPDDDFQWVPYVMNQEQYYASGILPARLEGSTVYYWKVVPTTTVPANRSRLRLLRNAETRSCSQERSDADNVPVWSFTTEAVSSVTDEDAPPVDASASYNYPNPFNPTTTISFYLPENGLVTLEIFNSSGRKVATLVSAVLPQGRHQFNWDGRNSDRQELGSGIYLYRISAEGYTETGKMIMLR